MKQHLIYAAIACALSALPQVSLAVPVTLSASLADGKLLGSGNHGGMFDGSALLPASYRINAASFVFDFVDDADGFATSGQKTGSAASPYVLFQRDVDHGGNTHSYYERKLNESFSHRRTGQQESVGVSIGGAHAGSGATAMSQATTTESAYYRQIYESQDGHPYEAVPFCNGRCTGTAGRINWYYAEYTSLTTIDTTNWSGAFSVSGEIVDSARLDSLMATNFLPFVLAVQGDLKLGSARLNLDVTEIAPTETHQVPEPSGVLLLLAGAAALAARRSGRARSRKSA